MTSKKSSLNPAAKTYFDIIRSGIIYVIGVGLMIFGYMYEPFSCISAYKYAIKEGQLDYADKIRNLYEYVLSSGADNMGIFSAFISMMIIAASAGLAMGIFGYMLNKKAINVYYSLGISRTKLLLSKYLAGATLMLTSVAIPALISVIGNIAFYGNSARLWFAAALAVFKIFSTMLYVFTIFSLCIVLFGSYLEALVIGGVLTAAPAIVNYTLGQFITRLIFGSPYSTMYAIKEVAGDSYRQDFHLINFMDYIMPLNDDGTLNQILSISKGGFDTDKYALFKASTWAGPVIFFAFTCLLAVALVVLHNKRKMEKTGFMGKCPAVEGICVIVVGSALGAGIVDVSDVSSIYNTKSLSAVTFVLCIAIMAVGYTVVELISLRSFKQYFKRLKNLGIEVAIFTVIFLLFATGLFGKFSSVPAANQIKSAAVTVTTTAFGDVPDYGLDLSVSGSRLYLENDTIRLDEYMAGFSSELSIAKGFTDKKDIEKITDINRMFKAIKNKPVTRTYNGMDFDERVIPTRVRFEYNLENGKVVSRVYYVATEEILRELSSLTKTDNYKKLMADNFASGLTHERLLEENIDVAAFSPNISNRTVTGAFHSEKARDELTKAMAKDILDGTLPLDYKSDSQLVGYLAYVNSFNYFEFDESGEQHYAEHGDIILDREQPYNLNDESMVVPVFADMKNTLAVCEKQGVMPLFKNNAEPVKYAYVKYREDTAMRSRDNECTNIIKGEIAYAVNSQVTDVIEYTGFGEESIPMEYNADPLSTGKVMPDYAVTVTDEGQIKEIEKNFRLVYPSYYDGYYVQMTFADGTYVYGYMPDAE